MKHILTIMTKWIFIALLFCAPAFAQVPLATDLFSGTAGNPLGANWTGCGFNSGAYTKLVYQTGGNAGGSGFFTQDCAVYTGLGTIANDQYVTGVLTAPTPSSITQAALELRGNATPNTNEKYISCGWNAHDFAADSHYRIWSLAPGGSPVSLFLSAVTPTTNDVVWCQVVGTSVTMKVNGSTIATVTDTSGVTSGYPGIYYIDPNGSGPSSTDIIFSNFGVGSMPSALVTTDTALNTGTSTSGTYTAPGTSGTAKTVSTGGGTQLWQFYPDPFGVSSGSGTIVQNYNGSGSFTDTLSLSGIPTSGVVGYPFIRYGCDQFAGGAPPDPCFNGQPPQWPKQLAALSTQVLDFSYAFSGTFTGRNVDLLFDDWICNSSTPASGSDCLEIIFAPYYNFLAGGPGTSIVRTINVPVLQNGIANILTLDEWVGGTSPDNRLLLAHTLPGASTNSLRFDHLPLVNQVVSDFGNPAYQWFMGIELGTEFGGNASQSYALTLSKLGIEQTLPAAANAPTISLAPGTYSGVQYGVKISSTNTGTKIICATIDGATPATNGLGTTCANDGHSFALQDPGWFVIGASETLKAVAGTSTLPDSSVTSAAYTINNATKIANDAEGAQCQSNAANCNNFTFTATFPNRFRVWDARSPFYSETSQGSNCNWASIESNPASPGTYAWTCVDGWLDSIHAQRALNPNFTAYWTMGMIPRAQVVTGIPGGSTGFNITGLTVSSGTTLTYAGSFSSPNLQYLYVTVSGMTNSGNNIPLGSGNVGQGAITSCNPNCTSPTSVVVTVASTAGFSNESGSSGTLKIVPGPKGMSIHPDDLPLQGGTTNWNGTPPSPGCSTSFHNFVVALIARCSVAGHCFKSEVDGIEGWNEPNNNFFWNPNLNSLAQIVQLLECEAPTFYAAMDGTGGTKKVVIQSPATTASATTTLQYMNWEATNGRYSGVLSYHHYFANSNPSVAPETITSVETNMANNRSSSLGWANTPVRDTETGFESTQAPYGCTVGSPWTAADCYGQIVRYQLLACSLGVCGVDWYNLATNCLKTAACALVYSTMAEIINSGTMGSCSNSGVTPHVIYQCSFTTGSGKNALWVWNYCLNDVNYASCSANGSNFTVPAGGYTEYLDLQGGTTPTSTGATITVTVQPVMLQVTQIGQSPSTPVLWIP